MSDFDTPQFRQAVYLGCLDAMTEVGKSDKRIAELEAENSEAETLIKEGGDIVNRLLAENAAQADEIARLNQWIEYVRMNTKEAAYMADDALSSTQEGG